MICIVTSETQPYQKRNGELYSTFMVELNGDRSRVLKNAYGPAPTGTEEQVLSIVEEVLKSGLPLTEALRRVDPAMSNTHHGKPPQSGERQVTEPSSSDPQ
jgi:hypothetical protein